MVGGQNSSGGQSPVAVGFGMCMLRSRARCGLIPFSLQAGGQDRYAV